MQHKRDNQLIDALEALSPVPFNGTLWRVVRDGRDPVVCSASGGRWDDATFDVLYTSLERNGAIAEMNFHLRRGQPVFPSRIRYRLHELRAELPSVLDLSRPASLSALGVNMSRFGQLAYHERVGEYPRTQEVAEVAHFLDHGGILVPNARWECSNCVVFCDHMSPGAVEPVKDHGLIDWTEWQRNNAARIGL